MGTTNKSHLGNLAYLKVYPDWEEAEQKNQLVKPKYSLCCFWGCFMPLACVILLFLCLIDYNVFRARCPIRLNDARNRNDAIETVRQRRVEDGDKLGIIDWQEATDVLNNWIKEESKDTLFVGTWQLEPAVSVVSLFFDSTDRKKTRLEIRPDYTFSLTAPYADMENLHNFRGTVIGKWEATYTDYGTLMIDFTLETDIPPLSESSQIVGIRSHDLWTLRENNTSAKYLRLHPTATDIPERIPSWKKMIDE